LAQNYTTGKLKKKKKLVLLFTKL